MASPAWLPRKCSAPSSQTSVMSSATGEPTSSSSTPNADSTQEAAQGKFISPPGYSVDGLLFSYMNASVPSGSSQQSSSSPVIPSTFLQFSSSTLRPAAPDHAVDVKNASPAALLQPPLPLVPTRLSSYHTWKLQQLQLLLSGSNLSFSGSPQMVQTDQTMKTLQSRRVDIAQETGGMTSATFVMQSVSQAGHMSSGSSATAFPTFQYGHLPNIRMPHTPQFQVPAGVPRSPVTPGPPGLGPAILLSSNLTATASPGGILVAASTCHYHAKATISIISCSGSSAWCRLLLANNSCFRVAARAALLELTAVSM
ncbi:hypothetical protein HAX54_034894 [Datura stramonium]|uniref:Uncharacterized protein n=1 Tax=Datura stramonium TaxID=4076 RepID=A0ABS8SFL5_DATST|nr:hypothetical protein [Datura stramonium]